MLKQVKSAEHMLKSAEHKVKQAEKSKTTKIQAKKEQAKICGNQLNIRFKKGRKNVNNQS